MFIQYTVLGFELMTFRNESPPITTRPGLLPNLFDDLSYCEKLQDFVSNKVVENFAENFY